MMTAIKFVKRKYGTGYLSQMMKNLVTKSRIYPISPFLFKISRIDLLILSLAS